MNFEGKHLLYVSDAFLHPLHMEQLHWQTKYDMDHEEARTGRVRKEGASWKWQYDV